jgi:hypothetical protein
VRYYALDFKIITGAEPTVERERWTAVLMPTGKKEPSIEGQHLEPS